VLKKARRKPERKSPTPRTRREEIAPSRARAALGACLACGKGAPPPSRFCPDCRTRFEEDGALRRAPKLRDLFHLSAEESEALAIAFRCVLLFGGDSARALWDEAERARKSGRGIARFFPLFSGKEVEDAAFVETVERLRNERKSAADIVEETKRFHSGRGEWNEEAVRTRLSRAKKLLKAKRP